jgi:large subunit ribosomal protein L11
MIKKKSGISKGSGTSGRENVGKLTQAQVAEIATDKMVDLNTKDLEAAKKMVAGTARSMGVEIVD